MDKITQKRMQCTERILGHGGGRQERGRQWAGRGGGFGFFLQGGKHFLLQGEGRVL